MFRFCFSPRHPFHSAGACNAVSVFFIFALPTSYSATLDHLFSLVNFYAYRSLARLEVWGEPSLFPRIFYADSSPPSAFLGQGLLKNVSGLMLPLIIIHLQSPETCLTALFSSTLNS